MFFRARRGRQPGALTHVMAIIRAEADNVPQAHPDAGNAGFNQEAVLSVYQQIFHSIQVGDHDGKTGGRGF